MDLPKPLQFQLKILMGFGEVDWGQVPIAHLDIQGIKHYCTFHFDSSII